MGYIYVIELGFEKFELEFSCAKYDKTVTYPKKVVKRFKVLIENKTTNTINYGLKRMQF